MGGATGSGSGATLSGCAAEAALRRWSRDAECGANQMLELGSLDEALETVGGVLRRSGGLHRRRLLLVAIWGGAEKSSWVRSASWIASLGTLSGGGPENALPECMGNIEIGLM